MALQGTYPAACIVTGWSALAACSTIIIFCMQPVEGIQGARQHCTTYCTAAEALCGLQHREAIQASSAGEVYSECRMYVACQNCRGLPRPGKHSTMHSHTACVAARPQQAAARPGLRARLSRLNAPTAQAACACAAGQGTRR